jgi:hypothetical protein
MFDAKSPDRASGRSGLLDWRRRFCRFRPDLFGLTAVQEVL